MMKIKSLIAKLKIALPLGCPLAALCMVACHAPDRSAAKDPITPPELHTFARNTGATLGDATDQVQVFQNNKLFLWRRPVDAKVTELVIRSGKLIDANEDEAVVARTKMTKISNALSTASDALSAAIDSMTEDEKNTVNTYRDLRDEKVTTLTEEEIADNILKTEGELGQAEAKINLYSAKLDANCRATLVQIGSLLRDRARLSQTDGKRDTLQKQIDDLNKTLPALSGALLSAKTQRDTLMVTYEGHFRDRERRTELLKQLGELQVKLPVGTPEYQAAFAKVDSLFAQKEDSFQYQYRLGKLGESLVNQVISNTDYFENRASRITLNFRTAAVQITIVDFPEKERTLSTEDGSIKNVTFQDVGTILKFEAHPEAGQNSYRFSLSQNRFEVTDGRIFYQGEFDLCRANTSCEVRDVLQHGIAKLATSN